MKTTNLRHQYCLLLPVAVVLFGVGFILLIVFAMPSLETYGHTRHFRAAHCDVMTSNVTSTRNCVHVDNADKDKVIHRSSYPCLVVIVNYTETDAGVEPQLQAQLFDKYSSSVAEGSHDNLTCSVHSCEEDLDENEEAVKEFMAEHQPGEASSFLCYVNPKDKSQVFTTIVNSDKVLHAFLWPSLALGFGFVIMVIVVFLACENLVCHDLLSGAKKARSDGKIYRLASFRNESLAKSEMQEREMKAERAKSWRVEEPEAVPEERYRDRASSSLLDRLKRFSIGGSLKDKQDKHKVCELQPMKRRNSIG